MRISVPVVFWLAGFVTVANAGDASLPGSHPLAAADAGSLLVAELRCAACHAGVSRDPRFDKAAPELAEVGFRVDPGYVRRFLASPSTVHPGTTMPDVLARLPEGDREKVSEALTHFLVAQSKGSEPVAQTQPADPADGKELYHRVGCVACHGPKDVPEAGGIGTSPDDDEEDDDEEDQEPTRQPVTPIAIPLGHVSAKYSAASLSAFLFEPLRVRTSGRMPDMKLTPEESRAIAAYLVGDEPRRRDFVPDPALVAHGAKHFRELNCAACHTLAGNEPAPLVGSLAQADFTRGCLAEASGRGPKYSLTQPQVQAIIASLRAKPETDSDALVVAKTMTAFRCIACHVRDDYGGVPEEYNPFFTGSEPNLGDDGRIPPPLTLVGAKLRPVWLAKVLFDGESVRPYMATRMPQYGAANLGHLPDLVARLDVLESPAMEIPPAENRSPSEQALEKELRAGGRELLGDKGLNCIACHRFNGKPALANQGIDLMTTFPRLEPGYFNRYLRDPGAFRPRTIMPSAWPGGVAVHKTILDGDTEKQIAAIWYYLSLGTSAADPPGLRAVNTQITVGDQARTYRGRSKVAGFRGIAVGLPEKISYAFNAETGTLSAIWQGDFIGVNWSGQGSGDFQPSTKAISLAQDVSFAMLADENAPWPLKPVMTKEAPVNPDPLYPKNVGYQFQGYFLGDRSIPTFRYRIGTIEVEDRSAAAGADDHRQLKRVMSFQSPTTQTVWFRALTGDVQRESDHVFTNGSLRMRLPHTETKLRPLAGDPEQSELLVRLSLPKGASSLEVTYELLGE
jgi:mono/diheme cytochrome c family protein